MPQQSLSAASLLAAAEEETGLTDFGDDGFRGPLEHVAAITRDLNFNVQGLAIFRATLVRLLVNRLRLNAELKAHPGIMAENVDDPIFVLGLPRTGTTKLQRMISADPACQVSATWRVFNPAPFPGEVSGNPKERIAWAARAGAAAGTDDRYNRIHEFSALDGEEDGFVGVGAFNYVMQFISAPSQPYLDWVRMVPRTQPLSYLKYVLKHLQWQDGGKRGRHWLLKNPGHTGSIKELLELFPRATFIMAERDLYTTLGSYCQMMYEIYQQSFDHVDKIELGAQALDYWGDELDRYTAARTCLGKDLRLVAAPYRRMLNDAVGIAREAYTLHGLTLSPAGEAAMRAWEANNRQHKHGKFVYRSEDFGITEARIRNRFGALASEWRDYK